MLRMLSEDATVACRLERFAMFALNHGEALTNTSIAAGETKTYSATWTVGKSTSAGIYRLHAFLEAGDAETDDSLKIPLPIDASANVTIASH